MSESAQCPECGGIMGEHPLTAADGTPLGYGAAVPGGRGGSLVSLVCPQCGHAELRSAAHAPAAVPAGGRFKTRTELITELKAKRLIASPDPRDPGLGGLALILLTTALVVAGLVWLYLAAGPVMQEGGFVASGGPYEIAHPAPDWIWLPSVGFTLAIFAFFAHLIYAMSLNRPNLALPFWAVLFGSQAAGFFEHGLSGPNGERVWTWIVLGVVFALMALPAALLMLVPDSWRGFRGAFGWATLVGAAGGLLGALWVWSAVAG